MPSFFTFRVSRSDITISGKSKAPNQYVKISYGDESCRTSSVNRLPPEWNETLPIACSDNENRFTVELMREGLIDTSIASKECSLKEILRENGEDVRIPLQSMLKPQPSIFLCLQPSDETKNAEITLINLARLLLDIHPSESDNFVENVNTVFETAKDIIQSDTCRSLEDIGYKITAFVEFGDGIADASPYLKLAWCISTAFLKIIATQPRTDKRVKDLVKNLVNLFLITKETTIFVNPSNSLRLTITSILEFSKKCSILIHDYAPRSFLIRSVMQNKKSAVEDLESSLTDLKKELDSAFIRQDIIETRIEARMRISENLREKLEKKLQPKHEGRTDRQICLEGTRIGLLQEIGEWVRDVNTPNVFFILGRAGTGKSTIATTIAEEFQRKGQLGSHQYFLRDKSDPAFIFRTIAFDLASRSQATAEAINAQLDANDITSATPERAFEILLFDPIQAISKSKEDDNILIVLDALDECGHRELRRPYIRIIKEKLKKLPPNYRFLITSRPEEDITTPNELERLRFRHMDLDHESDNAKRDVLKYIQNTLGALKSDGRIKVDPSWPWDESIRTLGDAAGGLFIWASTAVRLIESKKQNKAGELKRLVNTRSLSLDDLYATALENSLDWDDATRSDFQGVFSTIIFGKEHLSTTSIDMLMGFDGGTTQSLLECLRSLVAFELNQPTRLYHTSLYDYLISEGARGNAWSINEEREKARISKQCFGLMEGLRYNMCKLETSYRLNKDIPGLEKRLKDNISTSLLYACRHWASHLREASYSEDLCKQVESFAYNRLLFWVEVLSLTGSLYAFLLQSLESAIAWIGGKHVQLSEFLQDAHDQLLRFIEPIHQSSPHLYMTFLPLMKEDSIIAKHYAKQPQSMTRVQYAGSKPRIACTKQITVGSSVNSISYSPDGNRVASGSRAGTVSVWDTVSGRQLLGPLEGHLDFVRSVAYSEDGKYIVSGSNDHTVRIWNAFTGESILGPLIGHSNKVNSVAISGDGTLIASGSYDKTVRLWNAECGAPVGEPLAGHSSWVESVVFSPNWSYLASGSMDGTIAVWDVQNKEMISDLFEGQPDPVYSLSFSPDSRRVTSGSWYGTIRVWEVSSSTILHKFSGDGMSIVSSVAYSGDGKHILSGSYDKIVRIWDTEDSNAPPKRFEGHVAWVDSVSFAPDCKHFASGSFDGTIRIWDIEKGVTPSESESEAQSGAISAIAISPITGMFIVSGSNDGTLCVWNVESGELIKGPLFGHSNSVLSVAFSSNENHFASGSPDGSIRIWNMINDNFATYNGHTSWVRSVAFSPDGSHLASGSDDNLIRIWNVSGVPLAAERILKHTKFVLSVCYSPDGKKIVSGSADNTVCIWNASNGDLLSTFEGHSHSVSSVAHSFDGLYIVSGSRDCTIRVWNAKTSQEMYGPISGHADGVNSLCFSLDGKWIISGSSDKTIRVFNASTGNLFFKSRVPSKVYSVSAFPTSDGKYINFASGSEDGTIHIWCVDVDSKGEEWCLKDDGWLTGNSGNLLMWIPSDLRPTLVYGPRTLNTRFSTSLDSSVYRGDQWTASFPSHHMLP